MKIKVILSLFLTIFLIQEMWAQRDLKDTVRDKWTAHFQSTVISQKHSGFKAKYSGLNSLADSVEPAATSLTATLFLGRKLWKGATFYFNPEISGGKGLSFAQGVAGALNGETFRVGDVAPQVYIARAYLQQHIPIGNTGYEYLKDDFNQIAEVVPTSRITISLGKFAISDFYDDNLYSKDPRTQFLNWSMWANAAWDYPANIRGYTFGGVVELIKPKWALRFSSVAVSKVANSSQMEYRLGKAHSETFEAEHQLLIGNQPGKIRFLVSNTYSRAPSYKEGLQAIADGNNFLLDVIRGISEKKTYGGHKLGLGLNLEQQLTKDLGLFSRLGWNDGKYVSWAFTEIDNTFNLGLSQKGTPWGRPDDIWGLGVVTNGISKGHRDFLAAGGYGFIIGDGALNYGREKIIETYYSAMLTKFLWVSFDYQFVDHPGYNKARGPVHVFALRGHIQL